MQIEDMVRAVQEKLGVGVDGRAGPQTWGAIYKRIVDRSSPPDLALTEVSDLTNQRSEKVIATLHARVQPYARALYFKAREHGITINIISGTRTYAEQDALYAQGRTRPGNVVTNARGGYSNHNFGIAFDIGLFERNQYLGESPMYKAIGALGVELGLEWGGNWKTLVDQPHYQLRPAWASNLTERQMLAELRERVAAGTDVFA
ncbi:M15 family metallopeptidase [Dokdonella immobilis]|uniref:Peptidoglycan L-alanyl-D-glutamate endopeptidase CwlK n=1 Tax=Dokdonella immobilis TaxID=578942 RepID=A0A1I5ALW9_9GAMM|nr:M15 family metallopeptidase [Dokdonella immobilis]SFN63526.1 peptidoglycan L-alanyl-D-glutamate endopeptidase CwlK [Dokdonella immobilis]